MPRSASSVVFVAALPPELTRLGTPAIALDASEAIDTDDGLHIRLRVGSLDAQLLVLPGTDPKQRLTALVPLDAGGLDRLAEVDRLWRALNGRAVPQDHSLTPQQRHRLRLILRAIDGRAEQASYREIAESLFGRSLIADHPWKSSPWRDRVNRLVRDGRAMIAGGYRRLLRGRHRH